MLKGYYEIFFLNVTNDFVTFYIWQKPPVCSTDVTIYTTCLGFIGGGPSDGEWQTRNIEEVAVGAQLPASPLSVGKSSGGPVVTHYLSYTGVTPTPNTTTVIADPLGFEPSSFVSDVPDSRFRIIGPSAGSAPVNVGPAVVIDQDVPFLASFWESEADQPVDCEVSSTFYVTKFNLGDLGTGFVIDVEAALVGAAVCDFSLSSCYMLTYHGESNPGGCWTIEAGRPTEALTKTS